MPFWGDFLPDLFDDFEASLSTAFFDLPRPFAGDFFSSASPLSIYFLGLPRPFAGDFGGVRTFWLSSWEFCFRFSFSSALSFKILSFSFWTSVLWCSSNKNTSSALVNETLLFCWLWLMAWLWSWALTLLVLWLLLITRELPSCCSLCSCYSWIYWKWSSTSGTSFVINPRLYSSWKVTSWTSIFPSSSLMYSMSWLIGAFSKYSGKFAYHLASIILFMSSTCRL